MVIAFCLGPETKLNNRFNSSIVLSRIAFGSDLKGSVLATNILRLLAGTTAPES
jgi:hypothetical protein